MKKSAFAILLSATALAATSPLAAAPEDFAEIVAEDGRLDAHRQLDENRQPATVLDFAALERGAVVADFLAGSGYYTELFSQVVGPQGRIYVMNPPGFHNAEAWEAITAARDNVSTMVVPPKHLLLAPQSVDAIFTHLNYHDLYWESEQFNFPRIDVDAYLKTWHMALKPGGMVIVVDHHGPSGDTRDIVERLHRIDRDVVVADMQRAGFALVGESDALERSSDDLQKGVFDESVRGNTSRFMLKFRKL